MIEKLVIGASREVERPRTLEASSSESRGSSQEKFLTLVEILQSRLISTPRVDSGDSQLPQGHQRAISKPLNCEMVTGNPGASAVLGVSLTLARAAAYTANSLLYRTLADGRKPVMPLPMMNIINGEKHAGNDPSFQEFMMISTWFKTFRDTLRWGAEIYHALRARLEARVTEAEGLRVVPT